MDGDEACLHIRNEGRAHRLVALVSQCGVVLDEVGFRFDLELRGFGCEGLAAG